MPIIRQGDGTFEKMSTKTAQERELLYRIRPLSTPDLAWKCEEIQYNVYMLDQGEFLQKYVHFYGPAIVVTEEIQGTYATSRYHINDPKVWKWISLLMNTGITKNLMQNVHKTL